MTVTFVRVVGLTEIQANISGCLTAAYTVILIDNLTKVNNLTGVAVIPHFCDSDSLRLSLKESQLQESTLFPLSNPWLIK